MIRIITVIDAMMGSGKTQAMYHEIRNNPDKSYMVITPYLQTIQDAKQAGINIREPEYKGGNKLDSLKYLLSHGHNIACTHSLFLMVDDEVWDLVKDGGYTLFIDEALDVIKPINDLIDDPTYCVRANTAEFLVSQGIIEVDDLCRVRWIAKPWEADQNRPDYEYKYLEQLVKGGNVLCVEGKLFLWMFPPQIFTAFDNIYILSYLFRGSVFDAYLKIYGFEYTLGGVSGEYGKGFSFDAYHDDADQRRALAPCIKLYDGKANGIGAKRYNLSSSWYDKAQPDDLETVKRGFNTFYKSVKAPDKQLMWTCFKKYEDAVKIDGAVNIRKLTKDEQRAMKADKERHDPELNKLRCFVSCNARATNDYDNRNALAYLVNRYHNPLLRRMFKDKHGIILNQDAFALSEMLQWIWRSRIRVNALPLEQRSIDIYVPSVRMRELLQGWLNGSNFE